MAWDLGLGRAAAANWANVGTILFFGLALGLAKRLVPLLLNK